jgi:hypothetical protein
MTKALTSILCELEGLKTRFAPGDAARKLELLRCLGSPRLKTAAQVARLHETLLFMRAYPDDRAVLTSVEALLARFSRRRDVRRRARELANSGIAGTPIHYRFFAPAARWLAQRCGEQLGVDWRALESSAALEAYFEPMTLFAETVGLDELPLAAREWVAAMKGPSESDAGFLIRRLFTLDAAPRLLEQLYDQVDLPCVLSPGPDTPARTTLKFTGTEPHWQTRPLRRERPSLAAELRIPPLDVRVASPREARELIDLARAMMVAMDRDLDVFSYASDADVRLADCGEGLVFAFLGFVPERRLMLEALYGYLVLKNGVPTGYGTVASLFGTAELAFNISSSFRGGEGAHVFCRLMACARHLFGADTFSLTPYQIGDDNPEAVNSGAWWFYQKLGFRARAPGILQLMRQELACMRRDPQHRSAPKILRELATESVYLHARQKRDDVLGILPVGQIGLRVTRNLAARFGADRERAERALALEAERLLGVRGAKRWSVDERLVWRRWAPLVGVLPGVERWSVAERQALVAVIRAKGGVRESDYVRLFDRHRRLRRALGVLARE